MFKPVLFSELTRYNLKTLRADVFAGLTVGVVALPMAMAFAIACNFPPEKGLFTAVVAGFLISFFGGSKYQIGGPTGAFIVIISTITVNHGYSGLVIATIMAGILLIISGIARCGALIKYVPFPVVTGFTSGIAVVIFATQLKELLGLKVAMPESFWGKIWTVGCNLQEVNITALGLSIGTILVIVFSRRISAKLPAMLIGMIAATLAAIIFQLDILTIGERFGNLPSTLPKPSFQSISAAEISALLLPAISIAFLAGIESLLSATVADSMTGDRHYRPNTELIAQGIANIGAVCFGGIPATGAIARTATNIRCGARTPVAGLIHAATILLIMLLLSSQAKLIPLAALAGIMAVVCYNMSEYKLFIKMFKGPKSDWSVMLATFIVTVAVDLVYAVGIGLILAAMLFIRRMAESVEVDSISHRANEKTGFSEQFTPAEVEIFEITGPFFFGATESFRNGVFRIFNHPVLPKVLVVRMRQVSCVDVSGLNALDDLANHCLKYHLPLVFSGVCPQPFKAMKRYGINAKVGENNVCASIAIALDRVDEIIGALQD